MHPFESKELLQEELARAKRQTVAANIQAMLDFYAAVRAESCKIEQDGDALLYQWGTYNWGRGERFELDITRQFGLPDDDEPYQLRLTMRFVPTDELRALGHRNKWCWSPNGLNDFRAFVEASSPYILLSERTPPEVDIGFSQC